MADANVGTPKLIGQYWPIATWACRLVPCPYLANPSRFPR